MLHLEIYDSNGFDYSMQKWDKAVKKWDKAVKKWDSRIFDIENSYRLTVQPSPAQAIIVGVPVGVFLWQSASYTPVVVVLWYICPFA